MVKQSGSNLHLPLFRAALSTHSDALNEITYWRYVRGFIPAFGRFLVERPDLARALAADAETLAQQRDAASDPRA
jgi:hypothetical protein